MNNRFEVTYSATDIPLTKTIVEATGVSQAESIHRSMYG